MRRRALGSLWQQPVWQWFAGQALDIHDKEGIMAHCQHAVAFVGHSLRKVQRAVLISFLRVSSVSVLALRWPLFCSVKRQSAALFRRTMTMILSYGCTTARRWPIHVSEVAVPHFTVRVSYGSCVLLRGDFEPPRCYCLSDLCDPVLILFAYSVSTVATVVYTARDHARERLEARK